MTSFKALSFSAFLGITTILAGCDSQPADTQDTAHHVSNQSAALNDWFEARYEEELALSPMTQTYYGITETQDQLDDISALAQDEQIALQENWLVEMAREFDPDLLDDQTALSFELFKFGVEDDIAMHKFADHDYIFQHMGGPHTGLPSFMMNFHAISSEDDARAYLKRLTAFDDYLGTAMERAEHQREAGVLLPKFVYEKLRTASQNIISGAPFDDGDDSPLLSDFSAKVQALDIDDMKKEALIDEARVALLEVVGPTYERMISMFDTHEALTNDQDGVWKLPRGEEYYQARLQHYTTTDMSADEIHEIGVQEVARIQDEMRAIMNQVGFEGTLQEFFTHLRTDPQFTYADTDEGREAYMARATTIIEEMKNQLDDLFITKPKADVIVKRVEPFREASAFGAFYNAPAVDGSRPGTYYINLKDMGELPIYQIQALAYHEGIPGHHMQIALAQELEGLPKFRTRGSHTPYVEGWALYSESIPKELGLYTDPYQDFGRLSMEIFRAARLVLDTGIHHKKWTREQAVQYMMENTANSEGDIRAEIDRYIVWPGQATAYKVGMLKIQELRANAESELGEDFDIREFHDVILANGSVPLAVLETLVDDWVSAKKAN